MVLQQCRNYLYEAHLGSIHSSIYERWWWGCLGCLGATKASETYVTVESRASSCRSVVRFHVLRVVVHVAHARFAANHIARRRVTFIRRCRPVIVHERISFRSVIFQKKNDGHVSLKLVLYYALLAIGQSQTTAATYCNSDIYICIFETDTDNRVNGL